MSKVCVLKRDNFKYPTSFVSFRPIKKYPEYPFCELSNDNLIYEQVRDCFHLMELDSENYGKGEWNPLKSYVSPGDNVLIKPNLVMDVNGIQENGTDCLYTNPSVVAAVLDYVIIALKGKGKITIGDAPMQECKFEKLIKDSGYLDMVAWYQAKGIDINIVDFRELTSVLVGGLRKQSINNKKSGKIVRLDENSEFNGMHNYKNFRITNYDPNELLKHHNEKNHEYFISNYVLDADVIINMPKPKSHRKAGVTIAMKNFVGINARKEYLPHHTKYSKEEGGDEYKRKSFIHSTLSLIEDKKNSAVAVHKMKSGQLLRIISKLIRIFYRYNDYDEGSWYGNNTISKTICDLNKIVLFADKNGLMKEVKQRKLFIVADMVVMGEKEGPVDPSPKNVGIIAMGDNQVEFDETIVDLMGFDKNKLPYLVNARNMVGLHSLYADCTRTEIVSNIVDNYNINLEPSSGWKGHVERL